VPRLLHLPTVTDDLADEGHGRRRGGITFYRSQSIEQPGWSGMRGQRRRAQGEEGEGLGGFYGTLEVKRSIANVRHAHQLPSLHSCLIHQSLWTLARILNNHFIFPGSHGSGRRNRERGEGRAIGAGGGQVAKRHWKRMF
jgi:hypothetical protein